MENTRQSRVLEIFFRGLRGEDLSVQQLADEYNVSTKSITRSINDLKAFLADHRELVGNTELLYSHQAKCYRLYMDEFLSSKELFALLEVMIGARAFSRIELLALTDKLKRFTTPDDRQKLQDLIQKENYRQLYQTASVMIQEYSLWAIPVFDGASDTQSRFEESVKLVLRAAHSEYIDRAYSGEEPETVLNELTDTSYDALKQSFYGAGG